MDYFKKKKSEKKWKSSGPAHTLGGGDDEADKLAAVGAPGGSGGTAGGAPAVQARPRTAADNEAGRARAAAAEARFGGGARLKRPPSAAAAKRSQANPATTVGSDDLPSRYIPPAAPAPQPAAPAPPAQDPMLEEDDEDDEALARREEEELQAALAISMSDQQDAYAVAATPPPATLDTPTADLQADLLPDNPATLPRLDLEQLALALQTIAEQPAEKSVAAFKTLATVCKNVASNPGQPKFRSLKLSNPNIRVRLVLCPGGLQFLNAAGFRLSHSAGADGQQQHFAVLASEFPSESLALAAELLEQAKAGGAATLSASAPVPPVFDRCTSAFLPAVDGPDPARFEVPPDFFHVTGAEAMEAMSANQAKREAESVLRTKAMRESQAAGRKRRYKRVLLRVRFADGTILQGLFRPRAIACPSQARPCSHTQLL